MKSKENIQASIGRRQEVQSGAGSTARMYPKVKVRVQDLDDQEDYDLSFSWSMTTSPGEYQGDSPKCVIRVPAAQLPKQQLHLTQESKVIDQKDKKSEVTDKLSTRASSVTRPRAVLSSPDNDEMIGSNYSKRVIQPSPLQNHNMVRKQPEEHKIVPLQITAESPVDDDELIGSKNSKSVIQPSPLRNHNIVQKRQVEHKTIPLQTATETPSSTRRKPACAVNDHTPSTTDSLCSTKRKPKTVKDQTLTKVKQSGIVASSQKVHLKTHKASSII